MQPMQPRQPGQSDGRPAVVWRDLLPLSRLEVAAELSLSLPWLLLSWWAAAHIASAPSAGRAGALAGASAGALAMALACSFMFFLTGLRQVHNAYHQALGVSRMATRGFMLLMSVLMLGSMHAVQINHLRHHRHCLQPDDVEAMSARLPWWQALLIGPLFPLRLHRKAWAVGTWAQRGWIGAELAANAAWLLLVLALLDLAWLRYHVLAMLLGQCLTAFFAVWTVHRGCSSQVLADGRITGTIARSLRGPLRARLSYNMFFHAEHHLFPAVPTCRLALLAARIDLAAPHLMPRAKHQRVF